MDLESIEQIAEKYFRDLFQDVVYSEDEYLVINLKTGNTPSIEFTKLSNFIYKIKNRIKSNSIHFSIQPIKEDYPFSIFSIIFQF